MSLSEPATIYLSISPLDFLIYLRPVQYQQEQ
jgi:hypothetical protein